jgi:glycosyltransferase involved in cell wall biosynthesis
MTPSPQEAQAQPTISVVVPVRNRAELVCQTLDSILAQQWPSLEIIVVDDGSTDDTAAVVSSRYAGRVRLLVQPNAGPSASRNAGLALASGEFLMTFDSDDLMLPGALAALAQALIQEPSADAAYGSLVHERKDGRRTLVEPHGWPSGDLFPLIPGRLRIRHSSILFRRRLLPEGGALYDPLAFKREDTLAVYRLLASGRFVPARVPVTLLRTVAGRARQQYAHAALLEAGLGPIERLLRDPVVGGRFQSMRDYLLGQHCRHLLGAAYKMREWSLYRQYFALTRRFRPRSVRSLRLVVRYLLSCFMSAWEATPAARMWRRRRRRR